MRSLAPARSARQSRTMVFKEGEGIVTASEGDARSMRSHTFAPAWSCRCKCGGSIAKSVRNFPVSCRS